MMKGKYKIWVKPFLLAIFVALVARIFVQPFMVSSDKMKKTLYKGDYVIINRLAYGLRLPITFIALPFSNNKIPFTDIPSYYIFKVFPYKRLCSSYPERTDVVAYNFPLADELPIDLRKIMVSRIIGLPCDTITIANKKVFVNGIMSEIDFSNLVFRYRIITDGTFFDQSFLDSMKIEGKLLSDIGVYDLFLTPSQVVFFESLPNVKSVREVTGYKGYDAMKYFPENSSYFNWNKDYFGPVVVPCKGMTVRITYENIDLYKRIIRDYENNNLEIDIYKNKVYINGDEIKYYTFKKDYFFVMDDNRDDAYDSRFFGFLPEDHLIGKVSFVWFSIVKQNGKYDLNWSRFLKKIN